MSEHRRVGARPTTTHVDKLGGGTLSRYSPEAAAPISYKGKYRPMIADLGIEDTQFLLSWRAPRYSGMIQRRLEPEVIAARQFDPLMHENRVPASRKKFPPEVAA